MNNPFDGLLSLTRLATALPDLDERAQQIIAYHLALERELDLALNALLARAEKLRGLGFGQKVSVLQATSSDYIDKVARCLIRFNDLRNMVAHGDPKASLDKGVENLRAAVSDLTGNDVDACDIAGSAAVIFGAISAYVREAGGRSLMIERSDAT